MKVSFTYIDPSYETLGPFHIGIASLIAYLRHGGHDCSFFHLMSGVKHEEFTAFLKDSSPDVVAFSITTNALPHLPPLAAATKKHSNAFTICGGVHPTLCPDEVIAVRGVDAVCLGEGEGCLLDLCDRLEQGKDISDIPNLWVKDTEKGDIRNNPLRPLIDDLDPLPFPDRGVFPFAESFDLKFMKRGVFMGSRGCPYNCAYCCSPAMKRLYGGRRYIRFRSADNLLEEVEKLVKDFPQIEYNVFHDDLLPMKKEWFADFTRGYAGRIGMPFEMNCHPGLMDSDIAAMAKEAGCALIRFGIESGNEHIRRDILDRRVSNRQIIDAFDCCHRAGIQTLSYNMIGLPFESRGQVLDTVRLNARVKPRVVHVSTFYPYPGTKAYDICQREGFLTGKHTDSYYEESVLEQDSISPQQLLALRARFNPLVRLYSRCDTMPKPAGRLLQKMVDLGVMAVTSDTLARRLNGERQRGAGKDTDTVYVLEDGKVKVWGLD
jgi:radical SAM superfamily enzyme YgiQ (UPF0313 family)